MSRRSSYSGLQHRRWFGWLAVLLVLPLLVACGQAATPPALRVVATIAPLGDWARQVGEDRVDVVQLVPAGVDPKTYTLTAADRQTLADADVVLSNGLGLEPWLADALRARDSESFVALQLADFIGPLAEGERSTAQSPLAGEGEAGNPPITTQSRSVYVPQTVYSSYVWLSPGAAKAQRAVLYIADTFTRADPPSIRFYRGNAERYVGQLENLSLWVRQQVALWPRVTAGSTLPIIQITDRTWYYFAFDYDITMRTLNNGQPTAAPNERVSTPLFGNRYMSAEQQVRLFRPVDAVLDPFASDTYVDMIRTNVEIMSAAVQQAATRRDAISTVPNKEYEVP